MEISNTIKIIVVDDREDNLHAMKRLLKEVDAEVDFAQSGKEALSFLIKEEYAVAILDVQMPEMNGFELAEFMKNNEKTANVPIIFVTAINQDENHVYQAYQTGAVDYLLKPFEPEHLLGKVKVFINI